jgi:hypothetical protein
MAGIVASPVAAGVGTWWVWVPVLLALAAIAIVMTSRRRQRAEAARGWRSRASELYSRSIALHDRLASSLGNRATLSPEAVDRLGDAEWMVDDVAVAVAGLEVGAPDESTRTATNELATTLGSVREGIHYRVQMPASAEAGEVVKQRLADLHESLGRFRKAALNGSGRSRRGSGAG